MSFRIRLTFRSCFLEGRKLLPGGVYSHNFWKFIERHLETPCICDLTHQTNICERNMCPASVGPIREQAFKRSKSFDDPAVIPRVNLGLFMLKLALEILQGDEIVERMNIAGDQLRNRSRFGSAKRVGGQQGWLRVDVVQILDNRKRLGEHLATRQFECGHACLRIDGPKFG